MSISQEQVEDFLQPVFAFLHLDKAKEKRYAGIVAYKFGWMGAYQLNEVCKALPDEMTPGRLPTPKQIRAVYEILSDRQGWRNKEKAESRCAGGEDGCDNSRFRTVYLRRKSNGFVYQASYPCPKCNSGLQVERRNGLEVYEQTTREEFLAQRNRHALEHEERQRARDAERPKVLAPLAEILPGQPPAKKREPVPVGAVLDAALTAPAPVKRQDGWEEF